MGTRLSSIGRTDNVDRGKTSCCSYFWSAEFFDHTGTVLSHVNDAGFWLVNESFGMTVPQTLRSWTAMKVVTSIVGISIVLALQAAFAP